MVPLPGRETSVLANDVIRFIFAAAMNAAAFAPESWRIKS
jgi:hypothetical protein